MKKLRKILLVVVMLLLTVGCGSNTTQCPDSDININEIYVAISDELTVLYDEKVKETVTIYAYGSMTNSIGSGFVYKEVGNYAYILTNHHVVDGSTSLEVMYHNKEREAATLIRSDAVEDIAILKVSKSIYYNIAQIGSSENSKRGEIVFTIGTPINQNFAGNTTRGIISGTNIFVEEVNSYMLQTDAAMNIGNSGGPLYNLSGEVIGINRIKMTGLNSFNFAIPIDFAMVVEDQLFNKGSYQRPSVGINDSNLKAVYNYTLADKALHGIANNVYTGLHIIDVTGNNAILGGLEKDRIIMKIGTQLVKTKQDFYLELYKHKPGESVQIKTVDLSGQNFHVAVVTLG